jgi:uncharacterized protein (DUF2235 family)
VKSFRPRRRHETNRWSGEAISPARRRRPEAGLCYSKPAIGKKGFAMTSFSQKTFRQVGLTAALALGLCAASTSSFAFSAEAQQMCTGDAFRLCSSEIPDISRVTACMLRQRGNLSVGCRNVMDRDMAQQSAKATDQ